MFKSVRVVGFGIIAIVSSVFLGGCGTASINGGGSIGLAPGSVTGGPGSAAGDAGFGSVGIAPRRSSTENLTLAKATSKPKNLVIPGVGITALVLSDGTPIDQSKNGGETTTVTVQGDQISALGVGTMENGGATTSVGPFALSGSHKEISAAGLSPKASLRLTSGYSYNSRLHKLEEVAYGLVIEERDPVTTAYSGIAVGVNPTIRQQMPRQGIATYEGGVGGLVIFDGDDGPGTRRSYEADVVITANFGSGTISGKYSSPYILAVQTGTQPGFDVEFSGRISGNSFAGTAAFVSNSNSQPGVINQIATTYGNSTGMFFGQNAKEVGGAVTVVGNIPMTSKDSVQKATLITSYGAVLAKP